MKKIIDAKIYNTETAIEIASYTNRLNYSDFRHCEESLYKTKKGSWFVAGEGGAMTRWCKRVGATARCAGEGIEPITEEQALTWCETHDIDSKIIEEHFNIEEA